MIHPYKKQMAKAFWVQAVSSSHILEWKGLYEKKFDIASCSIATAGSCFAQHIGRFIKAHKLKFMDLEPAPPLIPVQLHQVYSYGLYSARYGNIYTVRQLLQLFDRSFGEYEPVEFFWLKDGGYIDPFRPTIEPHPYISKDELIEQQKHHLAKVKSLFETCEVFIFTLGLTEAWGNISDGAVYPLIPGTKAGGEFDAIKYRFHNFTYPEIMEDLETFYAKLLAVNPACKLLLTVSPVPLAATATNDHILSANTYSKSVLRAVAGDFSNKYDTVDYFPSYEIISSSATKGFYYMADGRTVAQAGVKQVMNHFFTAHGIIKPSGEPDISSEQAHNEEVNMDDPDAICDENYLASMFESD